MCIILSHVTYMPPWHLLGRDLGQPLASEAYYSEPTNRSNVLCRAVDGISLHIYRMTQTSMHHKVELKLARMPRAML